VCHVSQTHADQRTPTWYTHARIMGCLALCEHLQLQRVSIYICSVEVWVKTPARLHIPSTESEKLAVVAPK
jgi:hypothetical protein